MKKLYRGDMWRLIYTIYDNSGNPLNLTGWQIRAEFNNYKYNTSIKKTSGVAGGPGGIEVIDAANGKIRINFYVEDTSPLTPDVYNLEVEITKGTEKYTVVREQFEVLEDIIRW